MKKGETGSDTHLLVFFWEPQITNLIEAIASGIVRVDFDARENAPPKKTLRNHGTKFRIKFENLQFIYHHNSEMDNSLISPTFENESVQPTFKI